MKLLIDMNLSPDWVDVLVAAGWEATHWSSVGDCRAPDKVIMAWAREHGYVVVTHDLDFSALLAATQAIGPSVIQVRAQDVSPDAMRATLVNAIRHFRSQLEAGALISVDPMRARARVLPIE